MHTHITRSFGVAGIVIAVLAVVSSFLTTILPFGLSPSQRALFDTALLIQVAGPGLAMGFGVAALRGDAHSRKFGFVAIALSVIVFVVLSAFTFPRVIRPRLSGMRPSANTSLLETAAGPFAFSYSLAERGPGLDPPQAQPYGRQT